MNPSPGPRSRSSGSVPAMPPRSPIRIAFFARDPWYASPACRRRCSSGSTPVGVRGRVLCRRRRRDRSPARGFDLNLTTLPDGRIFVEVGRALPGSLRWEHAGARPLREADASACARSRARHDAVLASRAFRRDDSRCRVYRPHERRAKSYLITRRRVAGARPLLLRVHRLHEPLPDVLVLHGRRSYRWGNSGERTRVWDSCLAEGFQREASGHHPGSSPGRPRAALLVPQALATTSPGLFGRPGCVGCGRCAMRRARGRSALSACWASLGSR